MNHFIKYTAAFLLCLLSALTVQAIEALNLGDLNLSGNTIYSPRMQERINAYEAIKDSSYQTKITALQRVNHELPVIYNSSMLIKLLGNSENISQSDMSAFYKQLTNQSIPLTEALQALNLIVMHNCFPALHIACFKKIVDFIAVNKNNIQSDDAFQMRLIVDFYALIFQFKNAVKQDTENKILVHLQDIEDKILVHLDEIVLQKSKLFTFEWKIIDEILKRPSVSDYYFDQAANKMVNLMYDQSINIEKFKNDAFEDYQVFSLLLGNNEIFLDSYKSNYEQWYEKFYEANVFRMVQESRVKNVNFKNLYSNLNRQSNLIAPLCNDFSKILKTIEILSKNTIEKAHAAKCFVNRNKDILMQFCDQQNKLRK